MNERDEHYCLHQVLPPKIIIRKTIAPNMPYQRELYAYFGLILSWFVNKVMRGKAIRITPVLLILEMKW